MTVLVSLSTVLESFRRLDEIAAEHPELLERGPPTQQESDDWLETFRELEDNDETDHGSGRR